MLSSSRHVISPQTQKTDFMVNKTTKFVVFIILRPILIMYVCIILCHFPYVEIYIATAMKIESLSYHRVHTL